MKPGEDARPVEERRPAGRALRCPYCHDVVAADALERVACLGCGASHHAECFVEGKGCAATGCRVAEARLGAADVSVPDLAATLAAGDPEVAARLRDLAEGRPDPAQLRRQRVARWARALVGVSLLALIVAWRVHLFPPGVTWTATVALLAAATAAAAWAWVLGASRLRVRPLVTRPQVRVREDAGDEATFDPITGMWPGGTVSPGALFTPNHAVLERLRASAPGPPAAGADAARPERCPACHEPLHDPDDPIEEPGAAAWFCHHCGADVTW